MFFLPTHLEEIFFCVWKLSLPPWRKKEKKGTRQPPLSDELRNWPTPSSSESEKTCQRPQKNSPDPPQEALLVALDKTSSFMVDLFSLSWWNQDDMFSLDAQAKFI